MHSARLRERRCAVSRPRTLATSARALAAPHRPPTLAYCRDLAVSRQRRPPAHSLPALVRPPGRPLGARVSESPSLSERGGRWNVHTTRTARCDGIPLAMIPTAPLSAARVRTSRRSVSRRPPPSPSPTGPPYVRSIVDPGHSLVLQAPLAEPQDCAASSATLNARSRTPARRRQVNGGSNRNSLN